MIGRKAKSKTKNSPKTSSKGIKEKIFKIGKSKSKTLKKEKKEAKKVVENDENIDMNKKKIKENGKKVLKNNIICENNTNLIRQDIYDRLSTDFTDNICCREKLIHKIKEYLLQAYEKNNNKLIYISGCPGSGKTLTIKNIIKDFKKTFQSSLIDCMKLKNADECFTAVLKSLKFKKITDPFNDLKNMLANQKKKENRIIIFDEIDNLSNCIDSVFRPLLDLLFNSNLKFTLIGISNDTNFSYHLFNMFPYHRDNMHSIVFPAYSAVELSIIVKERFQFHPSIISDKAIEYLAKSVSTSGGDARKLFSILKETFDNFYNKNPSNIPFIDIPDVIKSTKNLNVTISQIVVDSDSDVSLSQWFSFLSFLRLVKKMKNKITVEMIYDEYRIISNDNHIEPSSFSDFNSMLEILESYGLLKITKGRSIEVYVDLIVSTIEAKLFLSSQKIKNGLYNNLLLSI